MLLVNFLLGCNSFTLKKIVSSRMVFLEGNHSEPEIVVEKVLLSVPPGEYILQKWDFSLKKVPLF